MDSSRTGLDGIFLDDVASTFRAVENHRRSLWAYAEGIPLIFLYNAQGDAVGRVPTADFLSPFRGYLNGKGKS